jgi:hypothetical protein
MDVSEEFNASIFMADLPRGLVESEEKECD